MKKILVLLILVIIPINIFAAQDATTNNFVVLSLNTENNVDPLCLFGISDNNTATLERLENEDSLGAASEVAFGKGNLKVTNYVWWIIRSGTTDTYTVTLSSLNKGLKFETQESGKNVLIDYEAKYGNVDDTKISGCTVEVSTPSANEGNIAKSNQNFTVTNKNVYCYGYLPFKATLTQKAIDGASEFGSYKDTITVTVSNVGA